jgi:hypothetical protein
VAFHNTWSTFCGLQRRLKIQISFKNDFMDLESHNLLLCTMGKVLTKKLKKGRYIEQTGDF